MNAPTPTFVPADVIIDAKVDTAAAAAIVFDNTDLLTTDAHRDLAAAAMFARMVAPRPSNFAAALAAADLLHAIGGTPRGADLRVALQSALEQVADGTAMPTDFQEN